MGVGGGTQKLEVPVMGCVLCARHRSPKLCPNRKLNTCSSLNLTPFPSLNLTQTLSQTLARTNTLTPTVTLALNLALNPKATPNSYPNPCSCPSLSPNPNQNQNPNPKPNPYPHPNQNQNPKLKSIPDAILTQTKQFPNPSLSLTLSHTTYVTVH